MRATGNSGTRCSTSSKSTATIGSLSHIEFGPADLDAAIAELDARYLAGEAAAHANAWSLVATTFAAANRHQLPPTTPDWVNVDHRRVTTIESGELTESFKAAFDVVPDLRVHIEAVHRLSDLGAVVTYTAQGSSKEGFAAEWREIALMSIEGDKFSRNELFDEARPRCRVSKIRRTPQPGNATREHGERSGGALPGVHRCRGLGCDGSSVGRRCLDR